jgi:copper(I)-binding protein
MQMQGDVAKMIELKGGIPIPPGATVELKPKSLHVMFTQLKALPKEGESFKGTLTFEKAGTVDVDYDVTAAGN